MPTVDWLHQSLRIHPDGRVSLSTGVGLGTRVQAIPMCGQVQRKLEQTLACAETVRAVFPQQSSQENHLGASKEPDAWPAL